MRWLKTMLAVNGAVFLWRGSLDILQPTSFYFQSDAPVYAMDAVRILGITYVALGLIQLGVWPVTDRRAVRIVAGGSLVFAACVAVQAATQASARRTHSTSWASARLPRMPWSQCCTRAS